MTSGRPKSPRVDLVEADVNLQAIEVNRAAVDTLGMVERIAAATQSDDRDEFSQMWAKMQLSGAYEGISRTVRISSLKKIKENKGYRFLKGKKTPDGSGVLSGTWEEFCRLNGKSVDQADTDIANFNAFGEEALEAMTNAGIGYRELRQFRKLPQDQRAALIEVAQAGDKEDLQELAEELIAKAEAEKSAAKAEAEAAKKAAEDEVKAVKAEAAATMQAKDQLLTTVRERANKAEEQLSDYITKGVPADKVLVDLRDDIVQVGRAADDHLVEVSNLTAAIEKQLTELFDPDNPKEFDRNNAILLAQAARDVGFRMQRWVGRIQNAVETGIYPLIEAEEMYLAFSKEDGRPIED